jgi:lipoate-protein ligase A
MDREVPAPSVAEPVLSACEGLPQGDNLEWNLWVDDLPRPGWANMAIDQTLLDRAEQAGENWLRLYQWQPHCLSFGRHEPAVRRYDVDRIREMGLDTVRRPTGGRAVWHCQELTYSVAAPAARLGSLRAAYLEIHRVLAAALRELGTAASLAPLRGPSPVDAGACFARAAGGEVLVGGRKVVGSAQLRHDRALLQHGSILLEDDQSIVVHLTRGATTDQGSGPPAIPLAVLLGRRLGTRELAEVIVRAAAARWRGVWKRISEPGPLLNAAAMHFAQFQSSAWTWVR